MKKIIIVDDDREWNLLLKMNLDRAGFKTIQAFDGGEAIEKIEKEKPDLILLDITMPVMDGWEVYKVLREKKETQGIPVAIISSYTPENFEQSKTYQMARYLVKPISPSTIVQHARDILG